LGSGEHSGWPSLRVTKPKQRLPTIRIKSEVRADVEALFLNSLIAEIVEIEKRTPKGLDGQTLAAVACLNVMESLLSSIKEESQFLIPSWVWEQMDRLKKTLALPIP